MGKAPKGSGDHRPLGETLVCGDSVESLGEHDSRSEVRHYHVVDDETVVADFDDHGVSLGGVLVEKTIQSHPRCTVKPIYTPRVYAR